jgi:putative ABC transport system permease protein
MSFIKLILKNPFRKKRKAIFTIFGLIIAILLISFLAVFMATFEDIANKSISGTGDFIVVENDSVQNVSIGMDGIMGFSNGTDDFDPLNQTFIDEYLNKLKNVNGVERIILTFNEIDDDEDFTIYYINSSDLSFFKIDYVKGEQVSNSSEVIIGEGLAKQLNKTLGSTVEIQNKTHVISGVYKGNPSLDYYIISSIDNVNLTKDPIKHEFGLPYSIKFIGVLDNNANEDKVKNEINKLDKHMEGVFSAQDMGTYQAFYNFLGEIVFIITSIAVFVGCLIVTHTILSSVNDRAREIGVLKSIGWSNNRIILMIIGESLILCFIGGILGIIISVMVISMVFPYILMATPVYSSHLIILVLIIVLIISLIGSVLPALRAALRSPTDAMTYE